ncbi:MAG: NAD(P)-binding domain-containing protein, partial [Treponema sp.]|nr:NAD(P)-binding domain-containing protein [Treponema sp.]
MNIRISCIGSGNMGRALMKGAVSILPAENIGLSNPHAAKAEALARELGGAKVYPSNVAAVTDADFVFLAVKPQVLGVVLEEIAPALRLDSKSPVTVVSMAAGWSIKKIQSLLGAIPV